MTYPRNNKDIDALPNKDGAVACGGITGLKVRVSDKGNKVFYLFYYMKGDKHVHKYRIGSRKDIGLGAAVRSAKQLRAQIELGINPQGVEAEKRKQGMTLRTYLDKHYYGDIKNNKSWKKTERIIEYNFSSAMGLSLMDVDARWMKSWRQDKLAKGIMGSTINRATTCIKAILNSAAEDKLIVVSPLAKFKRLKVDKSEKVRFLDSDEKVRLFSALDTYLNKSGKKAGYMRLFIMLMLNTGIRVGEGRQLRWADIDLKAGEITVKGSYSKTGQTRLLPINKKLSGEIELWRKECNSELYVFPRLDGSDHITSVDKPWLAIRKMANLEKFVMYDLRHTFATDLIGKGVDIVTVSDLMGHSDVKMTMVYVHTNKERKQSAVDSL